MSGTKAFDMTSVRGVQTLILLLEKQGARVEWRGGATSNGRGGTVGKFPAKVFPPDPTKPFVLFHGTNNRSAMTLYRNQVRRAGMSWPGDDEEPSRKETPMSQTTPAPKGGEPMQHQRIPSAVAKRKYPPLESRVQATLPLLSTMPETFWTNEFVDVMRSTGQSGWGSSGMANAQEMLDWLGWRVVESKRNRNGWDYRWVHDPNAVVGVGTDPSQRAANSHAARGNVTDIRPKEQEKGMADLKQAVAAAEQQPAAPSVLSATPGPIATAFAEAERKKAEHKLKYERKTCETCQRSFTPDGYEHHIEATQHGENKPVLTTTATAELSSLIEGGAAEAGVGPSGPEGANEAPAVEQQQGDYEAMEQMATEAEARAVAAEAETDTLKAALETMRLAAEAETERAATLHVELDDANGAFVRREEQLAEERRAHKEAFDRAVELQQQLERAEAARDEAMRLLETTVHAADDGTWRIDVEAVRGVPIDTIVQNAAVLGVAIELRGRRA